MAVRYKRIRAVRPSTVTPAQFSIKVMLAVLTAMLFLALLVLSLAFGLTMIQAQQSKSWVLTPAHLIGWDPGLETQHAKGAWVRYEYIIDGEKFEGHSLAPWSVEGSWSRQDRNEALKYLTSVEQHQGHMNVWVDPRKKSRSAVARKLPVDLCSWICAFMLFPGGITTLALCSMVASILRKMRWKKAPSYLLGFWAFCHGIPAWSVMLLAEAGSFSLGSGFLLAFIALLTPLGALWMIRISIQTWHLRRP